MNQLTTVNSPHRDFESIKKVDENGIEYWEARELMPLLDYKNWQDFENTIQKAKIACKKSDQQVKNHFEGVHLRRFNALPLNRTFRKFPTSFIIILNELCPISSPSYHSSYR